MTDKELLELAALAAGITRHDWIGIGFQEQCVHGVPHCGTEGPIWNPLTYDGDALRLAVKLQMTILVHGLKVLAETGAVAFQAREKATDDYSIEKATRRAIVRAAAEIGKSMKGTE